MQGRSIGLLCCTALFAAAAPTAGAQSSPTKATNGPVPKLKVLPPGSVPAPPAPAPAPPAPLVAQSVPGPAPQILSMTRTDVLQGQEVKVLGRARPGATVTLMRTEPWNLNTPEPAGTAVAGADGLFSLAYAPTANATLTVADGAAVSRPEKLFVTPKGQYLWDQRKRRVEALLAIPGSELVGFAGAPVAFYGWQKGDKRARRLAKSELAVAQLEDGSIVVASYIKVRVKRKLDYVVSCVKWKGRFERPAWERSCGKASLRV